MGVGGRRAEPGARRVCRAVRLFLDTTACTHHAFLNSPSLMKSHMMHGPRRQPPRQPRTSDDNDVSVEVHQLRQMPR